MTSEALAAIGAAASFEELKAAEIAHRGRQAPLTLASAEIGALPPEAKAEAGRRVGAARGSSTTRSRTARLSSRPTGTCACWRRKRPT